MSLIEDLKKACDQADRTGLYPYVTTGRLRSLIRTYEIDKPGDTSDQPGQWQIRGGNVEAIQHNGSHDSATLVQQWISERGGGSQRVELDDFSTAETPYYIHLDSPREPNIVGPGWWVVKTADGIFFAVSDSDFHIIYVPKDA